MSVLNESLNYGIEIIYIYIDKTDVENKLMVTRGQKEGRDKLGGWD